MTGATIFSGGGGADIGMSAAGFDMRWGIEWEDDIASIARKNGLSVQTGDVTQVDPAGLEKVDFLHMSPPCPSFSIAKAGATETDDDRAIAEACAAYIWVLRPRYVTLENVWGYRKSDSWHTIQRALVQAGYHWNAWHLNAADYGVPQTRHRMFVAAVHDGPRPSRPTPTHLQEPKAVGIFGFERQRWVGWHEAIQDLIPELPGSELADWQKRRLPDEISASTIVDTQPNARGLCRTCDLPTKTVADTTTHQSGRLRAVLIDGQSTNPSKSGNRSDRTLSMRASVEPAGTVNASQYKGIGRLITGQRVVQLTTRCLARFQTFPDWYQLPESKTLACKIIGNAVPPLLMQRVSESLLAA